MPQSIFIVCDTVLETMNDSSRTLVAQNPTSIGWCSRAVERKDDGLADLLAQCQPINRLDRSGQCREHSGEQGVEHRWSLVYFGILTPCETRSRTTSGSASAPGAPSAAVGAAIAVTVAPRGSPVQ